MHILNRKFALFMAVSTGLSLFSFVGAQDVNTPAIPGVDSTLLAGNFMGLFLGLGIALAIIAVLFSIAAYVYSALVYMALAKKIGTKNPWLAWIPVANVYLISQMSDMPWWPILLLIGFFIPFVNIVCTIGFMVFFFMCVWKIFEKVGRPGWWVLLVLIPIVGGLVFFVMLGIAAWGKPASINPASSVPPSSTPSI